MIDFATTPRDCAVISEIVDRAAKLARKLTGKKINKMGLDMDITAAHLNGCPLDLDKLVEFDDANFAHDVFGISQYVDRNTGELTDCFLPRSAK